MTTHDSPSRPQQITASYQKLIDTHLNDLISHRTEAMLEIEDFAEKLFIHPTHLSNTIHDVTGQSACGLYQLKILEIVQQLLTDEKRSIREIAFLLTFEPSQFTKWFKKATGQTPKAYRKILKP